MTSICLLTACDPLRAAFLEQTASSVHAAVSFMKTKSVSIEWSIIIDGPGPLPRFRSGEYINLIRLPEKIGVAAARNTGLFATRSTWVAALDADDTINAAGLLEVLERHTNKDPLDLPGIPLSVTKKEQAGPSWIIADNLWHDKEGTGGSLRQETPLLAGQLADSWQSGWPVWSANLIVKRDIALRCGGWPALATGEDVGFALQVSEIADGVCVPTPVWRRRKWDGCLSKSMASFGASSAWGMAEIVNSVRKLQNKPGVAPPGGKS